MMRSEVITNNGGEIQVRRPERGRRLEKRRLGLFYLGCGPPPFFLRSSPCFYVARAFFKNGEGLEEVSRMSLSCTPSEPPPVDPNLPPPPPPPNLPTTIQIATAPSSNPQQSSVNHPSSTSLLPPKSFKDTLIQGSSPIEPPLVTYEELVAANLDLETPSPMAEDGSRPPQPKVPKVRTIWERLCAPWKQCFQNQIGGQTVLIFGS
ncbi:hypothetical protein SLA2020_012680 [Shorea laevis]